MVSISLVMSRLLTSRSDLKASCGQYDGKEQGPNDPDRAENSPVVPPPVDLGDQCVKIAHCVSPFVWWCAEAPMKTV